MPPAESTSGAIFQSSENPKKRVHVRMVQSARESSEPREELNADDGVSTEYATTPEIDVFNNGGADADDHVAHARRTTEHTAESSEETDRTTALGWGRMYFPVLTITEIRELKSRSLLPWMKHFIKEVGSKTSLYHPTALCDENRAAGVKPGLYGVRSAWADVGSHPLFDEDQAAGFTPGLYDVGSAWADVDSRALEALCDENQAAGVKPGLYGVRSAWADVGSHFIELFHQWHFFRKLGTQGHSLPALTAQWKLFAETPVDCINALPELRAKWISTLDGKKYRLHHISLDFGIHCAVRDGFCPACPAGALRFDFAQFRSHHAFAALPKLLQDLILEEHLGVRPVSELKRDQTEPEEETGPAAKNTWSGSAEAKLSQADQENQEAKGVQSESSVDKKRECCLEDRVEQLEELVRQYQVDMMTLIKEFRTETRSALRANTQVLKDVKQKLENPVSNPSPQKKRYLNF